MTSQQRLMNWLPRWFLCWIGRHEWKPKFPYDFRCKHCPQWIPREEL